MYPITRRNDPELSMDTESFAPVRVERLVYEGGPALLLKGARASIERLLAELDLRAADCDRVLGATKVDTSFAHVWLKSAGATPDDVDEELRRASDLSGVDLVIEPEPVTAAAAGASR